MWIIRFLNGPMAGQIVPLKKNSTLLGRAPSCDIKIPSSNISKEHTRIEIFDDKVIVTDVGSRNGTFINGVQVRSSKAVAGDKVAMHDLIFEVQKVPEAWANQYRGGGRPAQHHSPPPPPPSYGNVAHQTMAHHPAPLRDVQHETVGALGGLANPGSALRLVNLLHEYVDRVVMPGIYQLPELFEFKWVLAGMMGIFILMVTTLSTIPLMRILKTSIEEESQQHALTIATTLARVNIPALSQGVDSGVSVEIATSRPGVSKAMVISNVDGNVIAPSNLAGTYPDLPYVHEGRKMDKESVKQVSDGTILAMYPVRFYNSETGTQAITAWAVVLFDMSTLAVDNRQVLSLFITTLFISLIIGGILFYLLYRLIEYPIRSINSQLDSALKEGHETVHVNFNFPAFQLLTSNVSSALSRALNGADARASQARPMEHDRNREIGNLVELMGFAAMGVKAGDLTIASVNQAFESRVGIQANQLGTMRINEISDQALKLSVQDLIERVSQNPDDIASNELEFSGLKFQIVAQAVYGTSQVAYFLVVLLPMSEGE